LNEQRGAWRLVVHEPMRGARNMALDNALLETARDRRQPTVRFYQWSPACLSFGRNQSTRGLYDLDRLGADNIEVTRRQTGGLAVLHDQELTYSVTVPVEVLGGPRATYDTINRALVHGLRLLGVDAHLAGTPPAPARPDRDTSTPCFQSPGAGEVVVGAGKLVGSAQRYEERTILQHGSLLIGGNQSVMLRYMTGEAPRDVAAGVTLSQVLGSVPPVSTIIDAMVSGFEATLGTSLAPGQVDEAEIARAQTLESHYDSGGWIWRR
jgi:lipoate-protein ligase A